jgi:predicted N-acetyltransferase YhbS
MRLVQATPAEKVARDTLTASAWGRQLSTEHFLAREAALRGHAFARSSMTTWLWSAESILSSCETFEVPASRGAVKGKAFIVASVFTETALRGRGYAGMMMKALVERLSAPNILAVALFSEVGPTLYERAGFVSQHGVDLVFPARVERSASRVQWTHDIEAPPRRTEPDAVTLELSVAQCDWHVERERFYAAALGRPGLPAHVARLNGSSLAVAASFQRNELHVLWVDIHDDADGLELLNACGVMASRCGLPTVRVWETTPLPMPPGATRVERLEELPMLRALDGGSSRWANIVQGLWA